MLTNTPDNLSFAILEWANQKHKYVAYYSSNHPLYNKLPSWDCDEVFAFGAEKIISLANNNLDELDAFVSNNNQACFGYLGYDLKNEIEVLKSENPDVINAPEMFFFVPRIILEKSGDNVKVLKGEFDVSQFSDVKYQPTKIDKIEFVPSLSKSEYFKKIKQVKQHIQLGDIYEANFCQQLTATKKQLDVVSLFYQQSLKSPTPFSAFLQLNNHVVLSASPERYLQKTGNKLLSQPIKGTIKRGLNSLEDNQLKKQLSESLKDRTENIMIVDLVRNDLSKHAERLSVKVEELCAIYTFPQVHQMISTITAQAKTNVSSVQLIRDSFPMGSMTGAPKISAMKIMEELENFKRGTYSGAIGYFKQNGDFDFNVAIRTIVYNADNGRLSYGVGGAITAMSRPEDEYDECLVKAKSLFDLFE